MLPETRYAKSGDVHIAYQVIGNGPFDLVFVPGFISHVDHVWDELAGDETEEFLTGSRSHPETDRALATVRFTDIVGSTERAVALGDRDWRHLLEMHQACVRRELVRFRGKEVKALGDGFLATFDGPARAVRCAEAIRDNVRDFGLEVRSGLHTGEIEILPNDVGGIAVHVAARVAHLAGPGEVLTSSVLKELVAGSGLRFVDRGVHAPKGLADGVRIFAAGDPAII
jgi:class 3 adenylate cyclase